MSQGDREDYLAGSLASPLGLPSLSTLRVGGPTGARLLSPVLPGSDPTAALGG